MPTATWNGVAIATSEQTIIIEGNHYFPPDSVDEQYLRPSDVTSVCPWKGTASYVDVVVDNDINPAAGWFYPEPHEKALAIKGYFAFWRGVTIQP